MHSVLAMCLKTTRSHRHCPLAECSVQLAVEMTMEMDIQMMTKTVHPEQGALRTVSLFRSSSAISWTV